MVFNARNIAAFFMSGYLIGSGKIEKIKKRAAAGEIILSVYFHDPVKELFESCVKWFLKNGFSFISTDDLYAIATGKKSFPASAVIFTVDDGWSGNKENIAAVANRYQIPVTIFVSTQPVATGDAYWWSYISAANKKGILNQSVKDLKKIKNDERLQILNAVKQNLVLKREALTVEELQQISNASFVSVESHTVNHPILSSCTNEQSDFEIRESKKIIENWLHKSVDHFAYPNGDFKNREIEILKAAGYKTAYTTNPDFIKADNFTDLYTLPRFDVLEDVSFVENICRMTGAWFSKPSFKKG